MDGQWSDPFDHGSDEVDAMWRTRLTRPSVSQRIRLNASVRKCRAIVPEWQQIERAAGLAHRGLHEDAASQRKLASYY